MAETIVNLTLQTIRDLTVEEVKFLCGVSGQIEDAQKELGRLQNFLEDVDRRKYEDPTVLGFFQEIKDLCYQIEDAVDEYASEVIFRRRQNGDILGILQRSACAPSECYDIHQVGNKITRITSEIGKLISSMQSYGITRIVLESGRSGQVDDDGERGGSRRTFGVAVHKDFVGMEKDMNSLVSQLLPSASKDRVVSIFGMGGLGKTTLAQKIYSDEEIRGAFQAFAWVYVSKTCHTKSIFQDLLEQLNSLSNTETNDMGSTVLGQKVHSALRSHKCLIVLDDLWEVKHWDSLNSAFGIENTESKILITTRNKEVAEVGFPHGLGVLSPDEAWELLQKMAFPGTDPKGQHPLLSILVKI